ncbi:MAG TPA: glycoside hydrolase family 3 N-terminal domain-containing protein [Gemmatimonadaceae bacterium]|nr:glycoside hydrolase family 3 N-terminal domain-containing protein [Gemmatimonadaceae bacterium]
MMTPAAQLLIPALRWDSQHGFDHLRPEIDAALALGVGGFIIFGGEEDAVRLLTRDVRNRSRVPLLMGADLERGAGQQFAGATGLPPLAAIASLGDMDAVRKAARLTAREARTLGVNWDYAPVCDLDLEPENPIVGTRSFGSDARAVATCVSEWITACQSEGVLACAKHFPGHGRTTVDSHAALPVVTASKRELLERDLLPFRAAIEAGVASMMTAHVAYPALDASGAPATLSREILRWFLRESLKFDGLIVTDALIMEAFRLQGDEADTATRALDAGCDLLLYPEDLQGIARSLTSALESMELDRERVSRSYRRRLKWAQWSAPPNEYRRPSVTDVQWGAQLADRVIQQVRGTTGRIGSVVQLVTIDDDTGGPYPAPSRDPFFRALSAGGTQVRRVETPGADDATPAVILVFGDIRSWKGRPGYSDETRAAVAAACDAAPDATVIHFSHPRLADQLPGARNLVSAWGGESAMQQAAARWLLRGGRRVA